MKKLVSAVTMGLLLTSSIPAYAVNNVEDSVAIQEASSETEMKPKFYWNGTAYLNAGIYSTIVGSNNLFPDSPLVTSNANNPGTVILRVINSKGAQVGNVKRVAPGQSVRLDRIPASSGTYVIQGQTAVSGNYTFSIT